MDANTVLEMNSAILKFCKDCSRMISENFVPLPQTFSSEKIACSQKCLEKRIKRYFPLSFTLSSPMRIVFFSQGREVMWSAGEYRRRKWERAVL